MRMIINSIKGINEVIITGTDSFMSIEHMPTDYVHINITSEATVTKGNFYIVVDGHRTDITDDINQLINKYCDI